jgi:glutamine amidotransferase
MSSVGIIDFESNNSKSVLSVITSLGVEAKLIKSPDEILALDRLIIPGVGHIDSIVREMDELDFRDAIISFSKTGKFLLGICLGQHLLGKSSEESSSAKTLGILDFEVCKLPNHFENGLRVPHVGWNSIHFDEDNPLFRNIPSSSDFYFSHSYAITTKTDSAMACTEHSVSFTSVAGKENILSVQFHPEKSQRVGRQLLSNFCSLG